MTSRTPVTVQRVVFPTEHRDESACLYFDAVDRNAVTATGRRTARLRADSSVSFATYFNGFPASYWQRWTAVREVTLHIATEGRGDIAVMRSDENGAQRLVHASSVVGTTESSFVLPLSGFDDGGWYWFDLRAMDDLVLTDSRWDISQDPETMGKTSLAITTFNKPEYCVSTLDALADAPEVLAQVDRVFIIDQGTRKVAAEPRFETVAARLSDHLTIIEQSNLGGSGGFSRGMAETLKRDASDFVMLLDDDVEIEPESILRATWFSRFCVSPTIVGGHMLDLGKRSVLHAYSEIVHERSFMWGPADRAHERHNFAESSLRETPWLHRREDSDFNGWWMCLIPLKVVREIGLALPVFIKWDDAEYGLRAGRAGYPTVSLPGVALWHVSWVDKDDTIDWQAYFHARNRLIAALLHSNSRRGGRILSEYRKQDLKHLLSLQYYPVALRLQALRDVLQGPEQLHELMPRRLAELRELATSYPEMAVYESSSTPPSVSGRLEHPLTEGKGPRGLALALFTMRAAARHWLVQPPQSRLERPQLRLSKRDATWWRLPMLDSVLVDTADSAGTSWYRRDRASFRSLLRSSIRLNRKIRGDWNTLSELYRQRASDITSPSAWEHTFQQGSHAQPRNR